MAWAKLGTTTNSSSTSTIELSSLTSTKFNVILDHLIDDSGNDITPQLRFGYGSVDTGSNYAIRSSKDGGADGTSTSQTGIYLDHVSANDVNDSFNVTYGINVATEEKLIISFNISQDGAGSSTVPNRGQIIGKWTNTTNQYDLIHIRELDARTSFDSGSNLTAIGTD
jgi:hypothetical protein